LALAVAAFAGFELVFLLAILFAPLV